MRPDVSYPPQPPRGAGALVIGSEYRGLGVVRSLGRRGIPVWVLADGHRVATASRYAKRVLRWPSSGTESEQLEFLLDAACRCGIQGWTLYPTGDETAALIARHHATLSTHFRLTTPPWEVFRWAYDKRLSYELAATVGVATPWTACPASRDEVEHLDCSWPVIVKPAAKPQLNPLTIAKAWRVDNREELLARYDEARTLVDSSLIMVQELIPGGGETQFSFAALCRDGQVLAHVVARRTRQYPVDFGRFSTYVETIAEPGVEAAARGLLAAMHYTGLVEVEFKRDPRTRRYCLLDINPRVWGWHTLGDRAGVDFSYLQWQLVHDEPVPAVNARIGVAWVRLDADLSAAMQELRLGRLSLASLIPWLRRPVEFAIFTPDDPLPALAAVPDVFTREGSRLIAHRVSTLIAKVWAHRASRHMSSKPSRETPPARATAPPMVRVVSSVQSTAFLTPHQEGTDLPGIPAFGDTQRPASALCDCLQEVIR